MINKNIESLFEQYIKEAEFSSCLRPETVRGYKAVFKLFLKIMPEVKSTDFLTPEMLNEFFKRIKTRVRIVGKCTIQPGVKNSTIKTQYSKLNVFFVWLVRKDLLKENPLKQIKSPQVRYEDFRRLEDRDINKIYSAIVLNSSTNFIQRRDTAMISLLSFCGIRKGEFISLKVSDIDLEKEEITIRKETSKSKATRILKIHPTLRMHLKDYFQERVKNKVKTEFLIASSKEDRELSRQGLKHWVKNLSKKSGVSFHLHRFRHTFACKLVESDVNLFKIQKLLGHSSILMTMKYVRSISYSDIGNDISKISY